MSNPIAIYHMNCSDGTAAAAVFLRKFPDGQTFPLSHGAADEEFAPVLQAATEASHVYFLDCEIGYGRFLSAGHNVTIIDHHISKCDELTQAAQTHSKKLTYVFDNDKSGASLTWDYFFPDEKMPELIKYIEDADLWRLQFGDITMGVRTYCSIYFNQPTHVRELFDISIEEIQTKGKILSDFTEAAIRALVIHMRPLPLQVGQHTIHAYNVTAFQSVVGNKFSKETAQVALLYTIEGDTVRVSIRSCEGQSPTALDIAGFLGGGGHIHAAGAEVPTIKFFEMLKRGEQSSSLLKMQTSSTKCDCVS